MGLKNKNIFIDAHVFDGEFQGTLTYLVGIYTKFLENNKEDVLYFGARNPDNVRRYFYGYKNIRYIKYNSNSSFRRIFFEIPKLIDSFKFTHAHFQYIIPLKKNRNCKYIVTIHDILFNDFPNDFSLFYRLKRNFIFYLSAKRADYLLTVSNYSKNKINEHYKIPKNKILITPNAVSMNLFEFESTKINSKKYILKTKKIQKYVLYVSRIELRKNHFMLLNAFIENELWKKGFSLVFIGSKTQDIGLENFIENLNENIKSHIHWFFSVSENELLHFLNGAEFFVYPSRAEGFGIPPLEAAALSTPVLCSEKTAMQDYDFFRPFLFNPENYNEFLLSLKEFTKTYKNHDVKSIKKLIKEKYSWSKSFMTLNKIFEND